MPNREFVRSVGGVSKRRLGPILGWDGELAFCEASRLVRFVEDPGRARESLSVLYRRLYGFEYGYRLDVGFIGYLAPGVPWSALADQALQANVSVAGSAPRMIQASGVDIASALAKVTGVKTREGGYPDVLVPGTPAVLLESISASRRLPSLSVRVSGPLVPCYKVAAPKADRVQVRRLRGALWRLHTELEMLRVLNRTVRARPDDLDLAQVSNLINSLTMHLGRDRRGGFNQPVLVALASKFGALQLRELADLAESVRGTSQGLARKLDLAAEKAERSAAISQAAARGLHISGLEVKGDFVMGHKIIASGGAIVTVDSVVLNSFNRIAEDDDELKDALVQILALVSELPDSDRRAEATELAEAMIEAAASEKKSVFRASWDALKSIAPVVGSAAGVTGVIARFLGVA